MDRSASHHRYAYKQYELARLSSMNAVVEMALAPGKRMSTLHDLAEDAIESYRQGDTTKVQSMVDFFFKGMKDPTKTKTTTSRATPSCTLSTSSPSSTGLLYVCVDVVSE